MIRSARPEETGALMETVLAAQAELQPHLRPHRGHTAAQLRRLIEAPSGRVRVLDDAGAVVGIAISEVAPGLMHPLVGQCYLRWVAPGRRGRWGDALLRDFEAWAGARGARVLAVTQTGRAAEAYYRRRGYAPEPLERMYWKAV